MARKPPQSLAELGVLRQQLEAQRRDAEAAERQRREAAARREAEARLFRAVMEDVAPLRTKPTASLERARPEPVAHQHLADERRALAESLSDDLESDRLLESDGELGWRRDTIGVDVLNRLRRGQWVVQDHLDLHGLRSDAARERVVLFLREAERRGLRCVRIVHGKGLGSPGRQPVLKDKVKRWLAQRESVIAFCQARENDGGGGVLIVLLRAWQPPAV